MSRPVRYTLILSLVALGTCLAAAGGWRYARASAPVNGPIILLAVDGVRADHLPAYGYTRLKTPAIDSLAADGVVFERAYSHIPQTLPAHTSILTGRLPFETGMRDTAGLAVKADERLLSEMLGDRGFATAGVVSSSLLRADSGIKQGFAFFDAEMPETATGDLALRRDAIDSERVVEHWLDSVGTSRAFLFLQLDGRQQREGDERFAELSEYDRTIANVDDSIGHLLRYLKTRQLYDRSTIILVSSHGEGLGDHGEEAHGLFVYDDTLRVPLIVKQVGAEGRGRRVKGPVQHVDIVPTILDLAKAPVPGNLRGRSLTPFLGGDRAPADEPIYGESLYGSYHFGWSGLKTIVDGSYRYILAPREELYDLDTDPEERRNLADVEPEIVARLRKLLDAYAAPAGPPLRELSDEERTRLEAFGYIGVTVAPATGETSDVDPKDKWMVVEQYRAAAALAAERDWTAATDAFRTLVRHEPSIAALWIRLGASASRAERLDVAAEAFNRALDLEPGDLDTRLKLGGVALRQRRFDDTRLHAAAVIDAETAVPSQRSQAHELLARVALLRRSTTLARAEAALAEEATPDRPVSAYVEGRIAVDEKRYEDALTFFEAASEHLTRTNAPVIDDLPQYTADSLLRLERLPEAEYLLGQILKETPQSTRAKAALLTLFRSSGRHSEASALAAH